MWVILKSCKRKVHNKLSTYSNLNFPQSKNVNMALIGYMIFLTKPQPWLEKQCWNPPTQWAMSSRNYSLRSSITAQRFERQQAVWWGEERGLGKRPGGNCYSLAWGGSRPLPYLHKTKPGNTLVQSCPAHIQDYPSSYIGSTQHKQRPIPAQILVALVAFYSL